MGKELQRGDRKKQGKTMENHRQKPRKTWKTREIRGTQLVSFLQGCAQYIAKHWLLLGRNVYLKKGCVSPTGQGLLTLEGFVIWSVQPGGTLDLKAPLL